MGVVFCFNQLLNVSFSLGKEPLKKHSTVLGRIDILNIEDVSK